MGRTIFLKLLRGRAPFPSSAPLIDLSKSYFLTFIFLGPRPGPRTIALAEAFAASAISSLDEARSQIVTSAVAGDELLRFRAADCLRPRTFCRGLFPDYSLTDLSWLQNAPSSADRSLPQAQSRFRLSISTHPFTAFLLSHIGSHGCLLCAANEASDFDDLGSEILVKQ